MTTTNYLSTTATAMRYGISCDLIRQWRHWKGFPEDAVERRGGAAFYDVVRVDFWLRSRPIAKTGRPARWLAVVNHPSLATRPTGERNAHASRR